jgi:flagellar basal body-associated protein FliL
MAAEKKDAPKKDAKPAEETEAPKSKKKLLVGVGAVAVVVLGAVASMMAIPSKKAERHLIEGPFVAKLSKNELQVNLAGESSKRYLVMILNAEFFAYDEAYAIARLGGGGGGGGEHGAAAATGDPLFAAMLQDALLEIAARKTRDQVTDSVQIEAFLEEVRTALDPLLFPVYVGEGHDLNKPDAKSGLRAGESIMESTFRGMLYEHHIAVDSAKHTLRFDEGPAVGYQGTERDLKLENELKQCVYVDVTAIDPEFNGEVPVGVPGKVRRIYRDKFLVQ